MNSEDIDDFLQQVDEISKTVQGLAANTISVEDLDEKERKIEEQKNLKEILKMKKEEEKEEKIKKGRPGKGNNDDYKSFCKNCFVEYVMEMSVCTHCKKETLSKEHRHAELKHKLEEYKKKKASKEERKKKWENWRKTQAMYWKKTSTNYSKWDYFTSSEEEDNSEPILPKNDPNFIAMEKDFEERAKRREQDRKIALQMKSEGNEYMKKNDYIKAIEAYTVGIEKVRDMKELYTNRALAYLRLGNYQKVIEDCNKVLEFIEIFEKGYDQSPDACFKVNTKIIFSD